MIRSMYSGVAGMKAHQAKMDVIGNNIANVNTYGFKASRASFRDIYYQTLQGASAATSDRGGTNPSQIGYGVQLGSISVNHSRSSFAMTDVGLDVAIAGEGFFQVQDSDGNIFYTRAGMLDIDSNGNLVDSNGNFVLGVSGNPLGQAPGQQKIRIAVPSVNPTAASATEIINNKKFTITSSNKTSDANVNFTFVSEELPAGKLAKATITTGGITVSLNADAYFSSLAELNAAINAAITEANGGKMHPGGTFTISTDATDLFGTPAVAGNIKGSLGNVKGTITLADDKTSFFGGMKIKEISSKFTADGNLTFSATPTLDASGVPEKWTITVTDGTGNTYEGTIEAGDYLNDITLKMTAPAADSEYIVITQPGLNAINTAALQSDGVTYSFANQNATATAAKTFLGGMTLKGVSDNFAGYGQLTFTSSYDAAAKAWIITATDEAGNVYTGTADNAAGGTFQLTGTAGDYIEMNYPSFAQINATLGLYTAGSEPVNGTSLDSAMASLTAEPFKDAVVRPLTGAEIVSSDFSVEPGDIKGLPGTGIFGGMTFKNTSADFAGEGEVIIHPAVYTAADDTVTPPVKASWTIKLEIGGNIYEGKITEGKSGDIYLTNPLKGDQIIFTNPGFDAVCAEFGGALTTGAELYPSATIGTVTATKAQPSRALGLGSKNIVLAGGTEGGAQTVADLSSITIGADGVIEAVHAVHGRIQLGRIDLATFQNPKGLEQVGNTYFKATANSGAAKMVIPGTSGSGSLATGSLEQSNVDLSNEFSDMITTQRGFQANSRVITVSDTMLEELVNLKR